MNIAVLLSGISLNNEKDYKYCTENIKENLINTFTDAEKVDTFLITYDSEELEKVIDFYNPKNHSVINYEGSSQVSTYIQGLNLIPDNEYDFIITTRFDIYFTNPVSTWNINFDKFNFVFKELSWDFEAYNFVCDPIFLFNGKFLNVFIKSLTELQECKSKHQYAFMHWSYHFVNKYIPNDIHFITDEYHRSAKNDFFYLKNNKNY